MAGVGFSSEGWVARLCEQLERGEVPRDELDDTTTRLVDYGRRTGDEALLARSLFWRGRAALLGLIQDERPDAVLYEALKHQRAVGDRYLEGCTYMLLSLDSLLSGQILLSFNFLNQVLDMSQRTGDRSRAVELEVLAYASLGVTFGYLHDYQRGLDRELHAMTLVKAVPRHVGERMVVPMATVIGTCALGAKKPYLADVWSIPVQRELAQRGEQGLTTLERYCVHELALYRSEGQHETEAREAEALLSVELGLSDVTQLFFSICSDVRHLIRVGLLDYAGRLIESVRPLVRETSRPFVQSHFLRVQVTYQLARGNQAEASRLCMLLFEQDEKRRHIEEAQAVKMHDVLSSMRDARLENRRLSYRARHDELTHLRNRQALREDYPKHYGRDVCAISIDVDHFKRVNDAFGHSAGDEVLAGVARSIKAAFPGARCYRTGGDEFLVLACDMPDNDVRASLQTFKRLLGDLRTRIGTSGCEATDKGAPTDGCGEATRANAAATHSIQHVEGLGKISASVGYARGVPAGANELRALVERSDAHVFEAKRAGRAQAVGE